MAKLLPNMDVYVNDDYDTNYIDKILNAPDGFRIFVDNFMKNYLNVPSDVNSGLNTSGSEISDVYQIKYNASDLEGYLDDKLLAGSSIVFGVSGTTNKIVTIDIKIKQTSEIGETLLKDTTTLKKLVAGNGVTLDSDADIITITAGSTNIANCFFVDQNGSLGYATIQEAVTAAGLVATTSQYATVFIYTGTYTENINKPPYVNIEGLDNNSVNIIGKINSDNPAITEQTSIKNIKITHTATSSTDYGINVTSGGSTRFIGNQITTLYEDDHDVTSVNVTGAATIAGRDNQIVTARVGGTSTTNREIIAINAPNVTGDILVKNAFTIAQTTTDENDNLTGLCLGGSAASHVANLLYLVNTTNASYSGEIRGLKYLSNTVNKTFGNMTFQIQDSGAGDFVFVDITANSGLFLGSNIEGYYNGSGTAYLGSVAAGATLAIGGGNQQGMTETFTGSGTAKGYALTNDVFDIHANSNFNNNNITGVNSLSAVSGTFSGNVTGANAITTQHLLPLGQANTNYIKASGETRDVVTTGGGSFRGVVNITGQSGTTGFTQTLIDVGTGANVYSAKSILKIAGYKGDIGGSYLRSERVATGIASQNSLIIGTNQIDALTIDIAGNSSFSGTVSISPAISNTQAIQKAQTNNLIANSPFFYLYNATNSVMAVTSTTFVSPTSANVSSLALTNFSYGTSLTYTGAATIKKTVFCNPTITVTSNATVITCYWVKNWDGTTDPSTLPTSQASQGKPKEFTSGVPGSLSFTWCFDLSTNDTLDVVFASDKSVTLTVNAEYTILQ